MRTTLVLEKKEGPVSPVAAALPVVWTDPTAATAAPVRHVKGDPAQSGRQVLVPDLLVGCPGDLATLGPDQVISSGRWAARCSVFRPADRAILHNPAKLQKWVTRTAEALQKEGRLELVDIHDSEKPRAAVLSMLEAAPNGRPVYRTAFVIDCPDVAEGTDDPSEFFRLYVGSGGVVVAIPDGYVQCLGDPAALWPSQFPGAFTDQVSVAFMAAGVDVTSRAVAFLDGWTAYVRPEGVTAEGGPDSVAGDRPAAASKRKGAAKRKAPAKRSAPAT